MQRKLIALCVVTALATMAGCGVNAPETPRVPHMVPAHQVNYMCIEDHVYISGGTAGIAPMFRYDGVRSLPVRCPQQ